MPIFCPLLPDRETSLSSFLARLLHLPARLVCLSVDALLMNTKICATSYELRSFELSPIICEDLAGHAEPVYYTLQEFERYFLGDVYYCHCLHPFGGCVNCYK
jgi:hypothetical protein